MVTKKRRTAPSQVRASVVLPTRPFAQHAFAGRIEFLAGQVPMVFMTREAFSRMWHYVDIATEEVGWFGTVEITPHGNYLIKEVFLLEQEVSATQTELSTDGQAQLVQDLIETRSDGADVANELLFWGHSHVHMTTSPSYQDDKQMEQFRENGCPWFVRGILNKNGRMEFTLYLWETGVKIVDVPWAIYEDIDQEVRAGIEQEFAAKVSKRVFVAPKVLKGFVVPPGFIYPPGLPGFSNGFVTFNDEGGIHVG